jgi:tetratricopeptide (TPR) repeat protein/WD40 repeat protein
VVKLIARNDTVTLEIVGPIDGEGQPKAKIFISYSRKDIAFADRLEAGLKTRGFNPLIDRTEIYALEDWWKRIEALIVQADTIVFVLSPDAVMSSVCQKEVNFAASLNKRLAPVVHRRVEDAPVPGALARLNFIFFDDEARFEESMDRLKEAIETDIAWVRKHTEFGENARRWAAAGRPGPRGLLLRSPVLEDAERWVASRPEGAPAPTEEAQAFIAESRRAATQRRNADLSRQLAEAGDQASAMLVAMEGLPDSKSAVVRPLVPEARDALYQSGATLREIAVLSAPGTKIAYYNLSGDGSRLSTLQEDRSIRVWDMKTNRLLATHGPFDTDMVGAVISRSGDRIFIAVKAASVEAIDAITGAQSEMTAFEKAIWSGVIRHTILTVSANDLYAVLNPPAVAEIDPDTGATSSVVPLDGATTDKRKQFLISADGSTVVSDTGTIWNAKTGKVIANIDTGTDQYPPGVNLSPDGKKMVWQQYATAFIYDIPTGRRTSVQHPENEKIKGHERAESNIHDTAFTPDGQRLATAAADKTIRIWDVQTGALLEVLEGHREEVRAVSFVADGRQLLTRSDDGTVRIWAFVADNEILPAQRFDGKIISAFVQKDAVWLVVMEDDNTVTVWDYTHNSLIASLKGHSAHHDSTTSRARIDSQGRRLITSIGDSTARIWDLETGNELSRVAVDPHSSMIYDIGFSRDGKLAYAAADSLYVWEVESGKIVNIIRPGGGDTHCASFNPDATEIVAATGAETNIWNVATGKVLRNLTKDSLDCARYSPDGRHITVVPKYGEVANILDAKTGAVITSLVGHNHFIHDLEYSPDGSLILTTSEDSTARLWNAETGQQISVLTDVGGIFRARFSPDGKKVLTESGGPALAAPWRGRTWSLFADAAAMMDRAKAQAPRCLTGDQRVAAFLDREPPAWCVEMEKWPYQTQEWKDWLKYTRANASPPLPDAAQWQHWMAATDHGDAQTQHVVSANLRRLGVLNLDGGDQAAALAALDARATLEQTMQQKNASDKLEMRGDAKLRSGDQAGALAAYQDSLDILRKLWAHVEYPECEVLIKIGDVKLQSGDRAGAFIAYQECLDIGRGRPEAQLQVWMVVIKLGDEKLKAGDQAGALVAFQDGLDIARNLTAQDGPVKIIRREVAVTLTRIGDVKRQAGDQAGALAAYQESLDLLAEAAGFVYFAPDVWLSLIKLGDVKLQSGDQAGALAAYQESLDIAHKLAAGDQGNAEAQGNVSFSLIRLGNLLQNQGDLDHAIADYDQAIVLDQKGAATFFSRGNAYFKKGDLDHAIADFDQAITLDPKKEDAYVNRGIAHSNKGNLDHAIADYDQAIVLDPKDAIAFVDRGSAYVQKGDLDHAIADYDQAITLDPKLAAAYISRGTAYSYRGDLDHAIADYDQAIALEPKYTFAYFSRGVASLYAGDLPKALADLNQASSLDPKNAYVALWLDIIGQRNNVPSRLSQAISTIDMTAWPSPVIRMFLGKITPAALLATADDPDATKKKGQVCEANFFSGELALQTGAKIEAAHLFRLASDCPKTDMEWRTANAELKALGAAP